MDKIIFIGLLAVVPFLDKSALVILSIILIIYIMVNPDNKERLENLENSTKKDDSIMNKIKTKKINNANLEEKIIISNMGMKSDYKKSLPVIYEKNKENKTEEDGKNLEIIESLISEDDVILSADETLFNTKTKRDYDMFDMQANASKTSGANFRRQIKKV